MEPVALTGLIIVMVLGSGFVTLLAWRRITGYRRAYRRFEHYYFPEGAPPMLTRTTVARDAAALPAAAASTPSRTPLCPPPPTPVPPRAIPATTAPADRSQAPAAGGDASTTASGPHTAGALAAAEATAVIAPIPHHHPAA